MPDRISLARLTTDPTLLEHQGRLLLDTPLGGLTLLHRQLHTLAAAGISHVELVVSPADIPWVTTATASFSGVGDRSFRVTAASLDDKHVAPALEMPADLLIDVRALRQLLAVADGVAPVVCVDRAAAQYDPELKSPYEVGAPGGFDGAVVEADVVASEGFAAIGVGTTGAPGAAPIYLAIGRYYWHRVRKNEDIPSAIWKLLLSTMKPTDGIYARNNRRISLRITRLLLNTPVTANAVTMFTLGASVVAGLLMAEGTYVTLLAGAVLAWIASMLDGVDGEIARAKFQASEFGHWLEMVCDYTFYVAVVAGHGVGLYRQTGQAVWLDLGIAASIGVVVSFAVIAWLKRGYAQREPDGDYYVALQRTVGTHSSNPFYRVMRTCNFLVTRAAFPYYVVLFSLLALSKVIFVLMAVGANLAWMLTAYASRLSFTMTPPPAPAHAPLADHRYPMRARTADEG